MSTERLVTINGKPYWEQVLACPECGERMVLRYTPKFDRLFYGCSAWQKTKCSGVHGAHPDGRPLGIPATKEVKQARMAAHKHFDSLWKSGLMGRKEAYKWLQDTLELSTHEAHIGRFNEDQCAKLIAVVIAYCEKVLT